MYDALDFLTLFARYLIQFPFFVCTCRKNGMECTSACKYCCGVTCTNVAVVAPISDDILDLDDNVDGNDGIDLQNIQ